MTDANMIPRPDLRKMRAQSLAHAILQRIAGYMPYESRKAVTDAILGVLMDEGIEILSDRTRKEMGLPERGPDGWTTDEIIAIETSRLELLARHIKTGSSGFIPPAVSP